MKNITLYLFLILLFGCSKKSDKTAQPQNKQAKLVMMLNGKNILMEGQGWVYFDATYTAYHFEIMGAVQDNCSFYIEGHQELKVNETYHLSGFQGHLSGVEFGEYHPNSQNAMTMTINSINGKYVSGNFKGKSMNTQTDTDTDSIENGAFIDFIK